MTKPELRRIYKEKRSELSVEERNKLNGLILCQFKKIDLPPLHCVHTYIPSGRLVEPDTGEVIQYLKTKFSSLNVAVPKINQRDISMNHIVIGSEKGFMTNTFGVKEPVNGRQVLPKEIDLALIPLVCFDKKGNRVGHGKGFYDRFLADCRPDMLKIGLSFFGPVAVIDDTAGHDISLDFCCTPDHLYSW